MLQQKGISIERRVLGFISVYESLCAESIRFERSMSRPLVLHACYLRTNAWKECGKQFVACFGRGAECEWQRVQLTSRTVTVDGVTTHKYLRDDQRAQNAHDEYVRLLRTVKRQIKALQPTDFHLLQAAIQRFHAYTLTL